MTDFRSTNEKLAELLQLQTYDERMEMADWLSSTLNDRLSDMGEDKGFDAAETAALISLWAENELEEPKGALP